ncbi:MAG: peroxide stress protein YaaA [Bacteroidia bacterium]
MILLISPAKKLDFSDETRYTDRYTQPRHQDDTQELLHTLVTLPAERIGALMDLSPQLAQLNYERYQQFSFPFTPDNAKQALLSFKGDVYLSFQLAQYGEAEFDFAQRHLRILSGLYGLLRPLDLIQPYRLEMGTALPNARGRDLYAFWDDRIATALAAELAASGSDVLVNLASNEYFKAVQSRRLAARIITPVFKDERNGTFKTLFLYAKQARGAMADFAIRAQITDPEGLKGFTGMGYHYHESLSDADTWVFMR